jgi:hypothetical protein
MNRSVSACPSKAEMLERLVALRDEFVELASKGRYTDALSREWRELPHNWRMALLMVAGIGTNVDSLSTLASRSWNEFPEPERIAVRVVIRTGKRHLGGITALASKV